MTADLPLFARSLLEAAQKATPGPWHAEGPYLVGRPKGCRPNGEIIATMDYGRLLNLGEKTQNAAYIALCSPDAIATLMERLLRLEAHFKFCPTGLGAREHAARAEERARGAEQNEGYMRADLERTEHDAARLREALRDLVIGSAELLSLIAEREAKT